MLSGYGGVVPALLLFLFSSVMVAQWSGPTVRIAVNPQERFQLIEGFGVNLIGGWFREDQKAMFDMLIDDLGATMFRVDPYHDVSDWEANNMYDNRNLPTNWEDGDYRTNPELARGLPASWEYWENRYSSPTFERSAALMRYLNFRGIRPLIALFGPVPEWMTDDQVGPLDKAVSLDELYKKRQNHLSPKMYDAFAEEVVSMLAYTRSQAHVDFTYFSPFDETDVYPTEGPRVDPEEAPKVLKAVVRQLKKEGLSDVKLAVADQADPAKDYFSPILSDKELMKQVGVLTLHNYADSDAVGLNMERVKKSAYPQTPVWLTEYGELTDLNRTAENEWKRFSLAVNRRALTALNSGAKALVIFDAFDDYEDAVQRLCYWGLFQSAGHIYAPKKRYYATKQLYHFIAPGSQRIAAGTRASGLTVSAFRNGARNSLIIVGVKEGGPNHIQVALSDGESAVSSWEVYETTRDVDCLKVDTIAVRGGVAEMKLPDEAIFTMVGSLAKPQ